MRALIQRVNHAQVSVEGNITGAIDRGFLVLLGVTEEDTDADMEMLCDKMLKLRIFSDEEGKTNCSLSDIDGSLLVVSQFTLCADCRKGTRPSFSHAAPPDEAKRSQGWLPQKKKQSGKHIPRVFYPSISGHPKCIISAAHGIFSSRQAVATTSGQFVHMSSNAVKTLITDSGPNAVRCRHPTAIPNPSKVFHWI